MIGPKPLIDSVIARLRERLPEQLAYQLSRHATDVPLPMPRNIRPYVSTDEQEYPVVFVLPGRATSLEQTGGWLTSEREVVVIIEARADSEEHLAVALQLYEPAIIDALRAPSPPPPAHILEWTGTEPAPIFRMQADQATAWQSWVEITFVLTVYEEDHR